MAEPGGQDKVALENTGKDIFSFAAAGAVFEFDISKNEMTLKQGGSSILFSKEK